MISNKVFGNIGKGRENRTHQLGPRLVPKKNRESLRKSSFFPSFLSSFSLFSFFHLFLLSFFPSSFSFFLLLFLNYKCENRLWNLVNSHPMYAIYCYDQAHCHQMFCVRTVFVSLM